MSEKRKTYFYRANDILAGVGSYEDISIDLVNLCGEADAEIRAIRDLAQQPNNHPKPCHKDRACAFKDLKPCDDCEDGGDKELVEALEQIAGKCMSMHLSESHMIKTMKRIAYHALAKHKAKNN